jgi:tRNA splicing ligase
MDERNKRLDTARTNAKKNISKDFKKDRRDLEKRERELLLQLRNLERNGEHYKARLVAKQIASYRAIGDRNFEAETLITTRAQTMYSDHVVNRGEVEAIKGIRYANLSETIESAGMRSTKYAVRMSTAQELESISMMCMVIL